jgi:hypothetical protein
MEEGKPHDIMLTKMLPMEQRGSREWAELIVKLRWIGLENEARHLAASSKRTSAGRERYCRGWTVQHGLVALAA